MEKYNKKEIVTLDNLLDMLCHYNWDQHFIVERNMKSSRGMSGNDYEELIKLIDKVKKDKMTILEIGIAGGSSTAIWASYAKFTDGKCYAVDWYKGNEYWLPIFLKNMENLGLKNNVNFLHMSSQEAKKILADIKFDLIFIDGDHKYDSIKQDIELWYPNLKTNGIMCGHDCEVLCGKNGVLNLKNISNWNNIDMIGIHVGVVIAVSENIDKKIQKSGHRIWWTQKNI